MISRGSGESEKADEAKPSKPPLEVIFGWEPGGGPNDRVAIRRRDVLYGFNAGALRPRKRSGGRAEWQIDADWRSNPRLRGKCVFLRTRTAIVRTESKSIKAAMATLRQLPLFRTNDGTFVNLDAIGPLNFGKKQKLLGFRAGDPRNPRVEWILLSRRRWRDL